MLHWAAAVYTLLASVLVYYVGQLCSFTSVGFTVVYVLSQGFAHINAGKTIALYSHSCYGNNYMTDLLETQIWPSLNLVMTRMLAVTFTCEMLLLQLFQVLLPNVRWGVTQAGLFWNPQSFVSCLLPLALCYMPFGETSFCTRELDAIRTSFYSVLQHHSSWYISMNHSNKC